MKLRTQILSFLAFGIMIVACNTPTPPPTPAFKLKPAETTLEIPAGAQATSFVALERDAGFTDTVQMTFQDLPAGFTQEWTRDTSNGDCGVRLQVAKTVAPGEYTLNVAGLIGSDVKNASSQTRATTAVTVPVKVIIPDLTKFFPFLISSSPTVFSAEPGFTAKFGINLVRTQNVEEDVQLSIENLPLGVSASFVQNPLRLFSGGNSTQVNLTIANTTLPGQYALRVKGTTVKGKFNSTIVQLNVLPASTTGFKMTLTPVRDSFLQVSGTGSYTVNIEKKAGFTAPVTLSVQGLPNDVQAIGSTNPISVITAGYAVVPGTYTFALKGTGGGVTNTEPVTVTVRNRFELPENTNTGLNALDSSFGNIPQFGFRVVPEMQQILTENGNTQKLNTRENVALLALSDGKVLASAGNNDRVVRFNSDGTLDSSFGTGGLAPQMTSGNVGLNIITGFALQPDNKILVNGAFFTSDGDGNATESPAVARLNSNGSLDTSFGTGGVRVIQNIVNIFTLQPSLALAQLDLGRILIVTPSEVIRLTPGGNLDPDFDGDGRKPINPANTVTGFNERAVGVTDSQKRFIIAANITVNNVAQIRILRILQDGTVDSSFAGSNGVTLNDLQLNGRGIALDSQDRLLLPIVTSQVVVPVAAFQVIRLTTSGALDTSFDTDGKVQVPFTTESQGARAITVLPNNKIFIVGTARISAQNALPSPNGDFAAMRLNDNGSLDTTFGTGGKFLLGFRDPTAFVFEFPANPNPTNLGFRELFASVVSLPNGGALAVGSGFPCGVAVGPQSVAPCANIAKFNP